jgi:hypothetical protein
MRFKNFFEVEINRDSDDGMNYWSTNDDMGQLHFSQRGTELFVDFIGNQDEMDATPGPASNVVALVRALKKYVAEHPEITKITANVSNPDVGQWLKTRYNARQIKVGVGLSRNPLTGIYEIPIGR